MLKRAFSLLTVRSLEDDERVITGIASTPTPDRLGDIVEPQGAQFLLPLPLLSQHDASKPIGHVTKARVTDEGIEITAKLVKPASDAPPAWKARLDEAWADIKSGLVRGLSIGFKPIEYSEIENSWSLRFTKWLWLELSAVTIPANMDASIATVKSLHAAASGTSRAKSPGVSGIFSLKEMQECPYMKKSYAEQIRDFQTARAAKKKALDELMAQPTAAGETLDEEDSEQYETLVREIETIDKHIKRLEQMEALSVATAQPVDSPRVVRQANGTEEAETRERSPIIRAGAERLPAGIGFARMVKCMMAAKKSTHGETPLDFARKMYPGDARLSLELKAAVAAGTTTDATWAGPLVYAETYTAEFIEYLRPMTILGKFGVGGVPNLTRVPFNVRIVGQTTGATAYWVGQGKPKPLTKFDLTATPLGFAKIAAICVLTDELIKFSSPSADTMARDELAKAVRERSDVDFIDPGKAAVANVSPASITNGAPTVAASGTDEAAVRADIKALWSTFLEGNLSPADAVYIMGTRTALSLGLMVNPLGQPSFASMSMSGGSLLGVPVIVSDYVAHDSSGGLIILVKASDIFLADDGQVSIDASTEASLQMDNAPTDPVAAATVLVSMFQHNMTALRAERYINWAKRRSESVAYLTGANYG